MNKFLTLQTFRKLLDSRTLANRVIKADGDADQSTRAKNGQSKNRITLIAPDNSVTITEFSSAQSLSIRRQLKLVKIQDVDTKTRRPVFKLMTNAEYHEEEIQKRKEKREARQGNSIKGDKLLTISSKIGQHDLMTRVKNAVKWLDKHYEVRVVINGEDDDKMQAPENIYSTIESNVKSHGKIVQKRTKGNSLRFQILPIINNKNSTEQNEFPDQSEQGQKDDSKIPEEQRPL